MQASEPVRRKRRVFNTAFESGVRSLILLTACYPQRLGLRRLVILDHLVVHTGDIDGPASLHPAEHSRAAEMLVRERLVDSGLALMGMRDLIRRHATSEGFRFDAGDEAGTFVDLLHSAYLVGLKTRAQWLSAHVVPMTDQELAQLVRDRLDSWAPEFLADNGTSK